MPSLYGSVLVAFGASILLALVLTPLVMRLALAVGAVDQPNERKTHERVMPRMGGVAVFASFALSLCILGVLNPDLLSRIWIFDSGSPIIALAMILMLALGIWDDIRTLGPGRKFIAQLGIASLVYFAGFSIKFISFPNPEGHLQLNIFDYVVTTVWIIGVTNAVNLIDGLDGLASGVGTIACLTIAPIAYLNADIGTAILAVLLAGGLLGFLRYNFNPAKIFLGDSGSLVLGFALAVLSIKSSTKTSTAFAILIPVLALGLPIMETLLSMLRRFLKSIYPGSGTARPLLSKLKTMFLPDKGHIHHRLLAAGFSHRKTVLTLYIVSCLLGGGAFALSVVHNPIASLILGVVGTAVVIGIGRLNYTEMAVLKNGILLPLYDRELINRDTFQGFLDIFSIVISFLVASQVAGWRSPQHVLARDMIVTAAMVCTVQFGVFLLSGLYRGSIRHVALREVVKTTKGVAQAVIFTGILFGFIFSPPAEMTIVAMVLDFYLLLSCVLGTRISFSVLKNLSQSPAVEGKRVLLYGAGINGRLVLDKIRNGKLPGLVPVGFLDDDPYLEGKRIHGYIVFGGHWKLQGLINRLNIDEVMLVTNQLKPEILRRVDSVTRSRGMRLRKLNMNIEEMYPGDRVSSLEPRYAEQPVGR